MAGYVSEDDIDALTENPRELRLLRASAKRKFTKRANAIRDLMAQSGSRSKIRHLREGLIESYDDCVEANRRCQRTSPDDPSHITWMQEVKDRVDFWSATIEEHLGNRDNESASCGSSEAYDFDEWRISETARPSGSRRMSDPDWSQLREIVQRLENQGIHGLSGSPATHPGRSPPKPPFRPFSAPPLYEELFAHPFPEAPVAPSCQPRTHLPFLIDRSPISDTPTIPPPPLRDLFNDLQRQAGLGSIPTSPVRRQTSQQPSPRSLPVIFNNRQEAGLGTPSPPAPPVMTRQQEAGLGTPSPLRAADVIIRPTIPTVTQQQSAGLGTPSPLLAADVTIPSVTPAITLQRGAGLGTPSPPLAGDAIAPPAMTAPTCQTREYLDTFPGSQTYLSNYVISPLAMSALSQQQRAGFSDLNPLFNTDGYFQPSGGAAHHQTRDLNLNHNETGARPRVNNPHLLAYMERNDRLSRRPPMSDIEPMRQAQIWQQSPHLSAPERADTIPVPRRPTAAPFATERPVRHVSFQVDPPETRTVPLPTAFYDERSAPPFGFPHYVPDRHRPAYHPQSDSAGDNSPDAWIYQRQPPAAAAGISPWLASKLPKIDIEPFDGDPRNWSWFIQNFKSMVHDVIPANSQRITYLKNLLTRRVRDSVADSLRNPSQYMKALTTLHQRYGHPQLVARAYVAGILKIKPPKEGDFDSLSDFSSSIRAAVADLQDGGHLHDLLSPGLLEQVMRKLPPSLIARWGEYIWSIQPHTATLIDLDRWLESRVMANIWVAEPLKLISAEGGNKERRGQGQQRSGDRKNPSPRIFSTSVPALQTCPNCNGSHPLSTCSHFLKMTPKTRAELLVEKKCCFRCLNSGHWSGNCSQRETCSADGCKSFHHPLVHGAPRMFPPNATTGSPKPSTAGTHCGLTSSNGADDRMVVLAVVPVRLEANGRIFDTFAVLDTGSEATLLKQDVLAHFNLNPPKEMMQLGTFHGEDPTILIQRVDVKVKSRDETVSLQINDIIAVPSLNLSSRKINWSKVKHSFTHLEELDLPAADSDKVTILIGMDVQEAHVITEIKKPHNNHDGPWAVRTPFGWTVRGPVPLKVTSKLPINLRINLIKSPAPLDTLNELVHRFWEAETYSTNRPAPMAVSKDDERALGILNSTTKHIGERYESGLLWKEDVPKLPNNHPMALKRFLLLEKRLLRDSVLRVNYQAGIDELIQLGFARKLDKLEEPDVPGRTWYVPHHPVINPNKPGKVRIVFDGAAIFAGTSLNQNLLKGPNFLTDLAGVLLRFREHKIAIAGDIEKMFLQVRVAPQDLSAFRFLWREPGSNAPPSKFTMQVQIFGAISSPAICAYVLRQTAKDFAESSENLLEKVERNFYVDNLMDSTDNEAAAIKLCKSIQAVLIKGGFRLTQWMSNSRHVLSQFPPDQLSKPNLDLDFDSLPSEKTLGVWWNCETDTFQFRIKLGPQTNTKRGVLRTVASVYDPLGILAPITFTAKVLLQDIWRTTSGWDDILPAAILDRWETWLSKLSAVENLSLPRCLKSSISKSIQLHLFADASEAGYGAVAYLRLSIGLDVKVTFVMGKSRVSPLNPPTIPRLELQAAVLASRLALQIKKELRISLDDVIFWSDSTTVLRWIYSTTHRYHTFVANRIGEILESSQPCQWHHVPGVLNPADDCSRGLEAAELTNDSRWFAGPPFLHDCPESWPEIPLVELPESDPEINHNKWAGHIRNLEPNRFSEIAVKRSGLSKVKRIGAWVMRFIRNAQVKRGERTIDALIPNDLNDALFSFIRIAQAVEFKEELHCLQHGHPLPAHSKILSLCPMMDLETGLIRVGGRLQRSELLYAAKHPILLPRNQRITALIIENEHQLLQHASCERILTELRQRYWIPKARPIIQQLLRRCFVCRRFSAQPEVPLMSALPADRLRTDQPAFSITGIDFFGPISTTVGRRTEKRWGVIFTCMLSRAVHIELAHSLDTDSFLMAFWRFSRRRNLPTTVYSDNGTNLSSGERELNQCLRQLNQEKIHSSLADRNIHWIFSPPSAPHFGGTWERLIRSAKSALQFILKGRSFSDEVLNSAFVEVESLLNGRPLTHFSVDPNDPQPLTPNHLILGRPNENFEPDEFPEHAPTSRKRWRNVQIIANHFWRRWLREYVPSLTERRKWLRHRRNAQIDDIVIIIDPNTPRGQWPLGRIVAVYPGQDGAVRSARVRTKFGEYHRPVAKLCLLEESGHHDISVSEINVAGDVADRN